MEEWRPLKYHDIDLGDRYEVSNTGKIKSIKTNKILKTTINKSNDRECVCISMGKRNSNLCMKIHIAVASTFSDGYKSGLEVNHKDGNHLNNASENLEWVDRKRNCDHVFEHGLMPIKRCEVKCVNTGKTYKSIMDAERDTGDLRNTICRRINGQIKKKETKNGHIWEKCID